MAGGERRLPIGRKLSPKLVSELQSAGLAASLEKGERMFVCSNYRQAQGERQIFKIPWVFALPRLFLETCREVSVTKFSDLLSVTMARK